VSDESRISDDRAVIDRIVDATTVVLLVGPDETELHLSTGQLPEGTVEGDWLIIDVDVDGDQPTVIGVDHVLTAARRDALEQRMEQIRRDRTGGRFGR
jgi:hypothetical protein